MLSRLVADAPNVLPRIARYAPSFFGKRLTRPIFLLGCPRSGKTVLADLLGRHPDIAHYPDEANRLWHPQLYPWRDSPLKRTVPPLWVDPHGFAAGANASRTSDDVEILKATFGAYQILLRRPVFLIESALIAFQVPFIRSAFSGARVVHLIRDGRAVAVAWARRQHAQICRHEEKYRSAGFCLAFDDVLDRCASSWNEHIFEMWSRGRETGQCAPGQVIEVTYESLCNDPRSFLLTLAAELELDPYPFRTIPVAHIRDRNSDEISPISHATVTRIENRMEEALRLHGYLKVAE